MISFYQSESVNHGPTRWTDGGAHKWLTLATLNVKYFSKIPGLLVEDWAQAPTKFTNSIAPKGFTDERKPYRYSIAELTLLVV